MILSKTKFRSSKLCNEKKCERDSAIDWIIIFDNYPVIALVKKQERENIFLIL